MNIRKLGSLDVRTVSTHHQISYDLNIIFLQYQDVGAFKTDCIFDFNEYTRSLILFYDTIPCTHVNNGCGYIYLSVDKGIKRCCRSAHTDIGNFTDRIFFLICQILATGRRRRRRCIGSSAGSCIIGRCVRYSAIKQSIYFVL